MNIAYFGSPELSSRMLSLLQKTFPGKIKLVVTQPDKPAGKRLAPTKTPTKLCAEKLSIPVFDKDLEKEHVAKLKTLMRRDSIKLCILFAYGGIIPTELLSLPLFGFWNIHPSLLPLYRGASPTAFPLALGDRETGITLMQMNDKLDEGDIIDCVTMRLDDMVTRESLEHEIPELATKLITTNITRLKQSQKLISKPQEHAHATYTRRLTKQDGFIPLDLLKQAILHANESHLTTLPELLTWYEHQNHTHLQKQTAPRMIWNLYRALVGWPGLWTIVQTPKGPRRLKLLSFHYQDGKLTLQKVQLEGKTPVSWNDFLQSYSID